MKKFLATTLFAVILLSCSLSVNAAGIKDIFSANYYADSYEDLYAAFEYDEAKLFKHVKEYGLKEGRDVSPILDVVFYRETYPDLNAAFGDNWDAYVKHYFEYGIKEGRDNGTNFDIIRYVNSYADLREAFDEDYEALAKHYIKYGIKENRTLGLKPQAAPATQAPVFYEKVTYDADGRVEKVEVYSDSAKTNLVSYDVYDYDTEGSYQVRSYNAQDVRTKVVAYDANGDVMYNMIIEEFDEVNEVLISGTLYTYQEGIIEGSIVVRNGQTIKISTYYPNGNVEGIMEFNPETGTVTNYYEFYENGCMATQRKMDENGLVFYKEWDERGTLRYHSGYDENGYFTKEWDENGNLLTEGRGE